MTEDVPLILDGSDHSDGLGTVISDDDVQAEYRHHLVLHLDINETVLIGDQAGGDTIEESFHKMLAKSSFVRLGSIGAPYSYDDTISFEPTHWWNGLPIRERYNADEVNQLRPPLFTGWTWPEGCCPYYRTRFKARAKNFVEHHGSVYKVVYDEVKARLLLEEQEGNLHSNRGSGLLIPAFWETMATLCASSEPFTLVFRTFGTDLEDVALAVSAFARGQHPKYPNFFNEKLIMSSDRIFQGKWATVQDEGQTTTCNAEYQLWNNDGLLVASGDTEVLKCIHQQTVCGIRDDYPFWKENGWEPWAGKPVWSFSAVDPDSRFHHLLFDDNIHNLPHDGIASIRQKVIKATPHEASCYKTLSGEEILEQHGIHLIRVPTVAPILDPLWFVQEIRKAKTRYATKMESSRNTSPED